ncbi:hypothetical protein GCM10010289_80010 [Streptomyces violascens]|nr:hypothetical protein GCM10010289_80010 [Streptomyces violascens]
MEELLERLVPYELWGCFGGGPASRRVALDAGRLTARRWHVAAASGCMAATAACCGRTEADRAELVFAGLAEETRRPITPLKHLSDGEHPDVCRRERAVKSK